MALMDKVLNLLKRRGLTQADLASAIGVKPSRVTLWAQGTGVPNAYQLKAIANVLDVPMDYLVDDSVSHPDEVLAGLTATQRLLLGAAGFVEGGLDEALRRLLNRSPSTQSASDLIKKLRDDDPIAWELLQHEVMPSVIEAVRAKFGADWEWIRPDQRAWSAESSFIREVKQGRFDEAVDSLNDLARYLEWAAKEKCMSFLRGLSSNPDSSETILVERDQMALKARLQREAVEGYLAPLNQLMTAAKSEEERIVCRGRLSNHENRRIAESLRRETGKERPPGYIKRVWSEALDRFNSSIAGELRMHLA